MSIHCIISHHRFISCQASDTVDIHSNTSPPFSSLLPYVLTYFCPNQIPLGVYHCHWCFIGYVWYLSPHFFRHPQSRSHHFFFTPFANVWLSLPSLGPGVRFSNISLQFWGIASYVWPSSPFIHHIPCYHTSNVPSW